ncbi:MAG: hypothetical protein WD768_01755 [Phycisphaeraceae bacterium]
MPVIIRKVVGDRFQNEVDVVRDEWKLREQVEALEAWLKNNPGRLDPAYEWVADIGFCVRPDALGGGPPISRELMRLCLAANLEIYLSEYQGEA